MLLHGLCSSALEVRLFAKALRSHDFDVSIPEIPAYTATSTPPASTPLHAPRFREWVQCACGEIDRLAQTHARIFVCGVSLGATLALAVAAARPAVTSGLSLISTTLFYDGWNVSRWRFLLPLACYTPLGRFYRYRETPPYGVKNERVRAWIESQFARDTLSSAGASTISVPALREADRLIHHVLRALPDVTVPTLMIHAREDDVASIANVEYVQRHIGSTQFASMLVDNSYHMITLDNDRELAATRTAHFFNQAGEAGRHAPAQDLSGAAAVSAAGRQTQEAHDG